MGIKSRIREFLPRKIRIPRPWILKGVPSWGCLGIYLGMACIAGFLVLSMVYPISPKPVCGNNICERDLGEDHKLCSQDCPPICGNRICESPAESPRNCPQDCGTCGNNVCEPHENYFRCRSDCPPVCGNNICEFPDENNANCKDCYCGDRICSRPLEDYFKCPQDCSPILRAELLEIGLDKSEYKLGETIHATAKIANRGEAAISSQRVELWITVMSMENWLANLRLGTMSEQQRTRTYEFRFNQRIAPGEIATITADHQIPQTIDTPIGKISPAGEYRIKLRVYADGLMIGERSFNLRILS